MEFPAELNVANNQLLAIGIRDGEKRGGERTVMASPGAPCDQMRLVDPVNFYIAEHARSPLPVAPGTELWIEVTVPPRGRPGLSSWRSGRPTDSACRDPYERSTDDSVAFTHQGSGLPRWKYPPVGPFSGSVARATLVLAPSFDSIAA